mmetsp:Transcript_126870/g.201148  ORF Transcript_126870/g.201148 Transcript_126870/m.201148 type:complete len:165 (+) Transcript_126870:96-590(+)
MGSSWSTRRRRSDSSSCYMQMWTVMKIGLHSECFPVHGRSMMPTLHGTSQCFGSDVVLGVRPGNWFPLWPRAGEVVILLDAHGRMVKRLACLALESEEGSSARAWCWVEGDNARLSEDSRTFGWVPSHQVEAVAVAVAWPPWRSKWLLDPQRLTEATALSSSCF